MNKNLVALVILAVIIVGGYMYYQQHNHTSTLNLPGGKAISVTTHD